MLADTQTQQPIIGQNHLLQREHLANRHSHMMQKILSKNLHIEKYWVLGWVESNRKGGKTKIVPKMQAVYEMPSLKNEAYLYEIDNIEGTRSLLWVMHPNNKLSLPTIGKAIHVSEEAGD